MRVYLPDGTALSLTDRDHVASGGEGAVYVQGTPPRAFKVYHDSVRAITAAKVGELAKITDCRVVKPERLLYADAERKTVIGHDMLFAGQMNQDVYVLCQLFSRGFRERFGISPSVITALVFALRAIVSHVHAARCLIVDLKDMNFLVRADFKDLLAIDAGSYQTPSFKATAVTPTVLDPRVGHNGPFSTGTDWYAFAVIAAQMWLGIHPFRGTYTGTDPTLFKLPTDDPKDSIAITRRRMAAGVSVFDSVLVRVPKSAYPLDDVPGVFRDWLVGVFAPSGDRSAPPESLGAGTSRLRPQVGVSNAPVTVPALLDMHELLRLPRGESIFGAWDLAGGALTTATADAIYVGVRRQLRHPPQGRLVGVTQVQRSHAPAAGPSIPQAAVYVDGMRLRFCVLDALTEHEAQTPVEQVACTVDGRILAKFGASLYEIGLTRIGGRLDLTTQVAANCAPHATTLFDGLAVQTMLGTTLLTRFHAPGCSATVAVPELNGYRVVSARGAGSVAVLIAVRGGVAERFVIRFAAGDFAYDVHAAGVDETLDPNFTVTPQGVLVIMAGEGRIELASARPERGGAWTARDVVDPAIDPSWRLFALRDGVGAYKGSCVWKLKLK